MKNPTIHLVIFSLASLAIWIPIISWLVSPSRTVLLGSPGRILLILTVAIQLIALLLSFVFRGVAATWDERQNRAASRVFGWIGYSAALAWAWWVAMSMLEFNDGKFVVFGVLCLLYLIPAIVPVAKVSIRVRAALVAASVTLIASGILTIERLSPILIAPATAYVAAILVSGICATYAGSSHLRHRTVTPIEESRPIES